VNYAQRDDKKSIPETFSNTEIKTPQVNHAAAFLEVGIRPD
jgi:hypothetical protein